MADLNVKFIVFNDMIINTLHIRWCEKVKKTYSDGNGTF